MKKLFLVIGTACLTSWAQAGVVRADPNGDGKATVFLDAAHGLYWTDGEGLFRDQTQSDARISVSNASFESLSWRLPTVQEFKNLYETQGNNPQGRMIYGKGTINFDHYGYWTDSNLTGFAVNGGVTVPYKSWTIGHVIAVSSVPEPETYAMLLAGIGLIGFKRRKKFFTVKKGKPETLKEL